MSLKFFKLKFVDSLLLIFSFTRKDVTVLGKFTLNIFNIPITVATPLSNDTGSKIEDVENLNSFSNIFYKYFKEFLTMSHLFKMSVDSLNKANLIPNKDYNTDKLMSGMLQLPDKFQLVVDETILNAGELKQKGRFNLFALFIKNLKYKFLKGCLICTD